MLLKAAEKNPWLNDKTPEEIMALDYRRWPGIKAAKKYYDYDNGGVKTHQDYHYEDKKGELHLQVRQFYEDVLDENGVFVDYKTKTFLVRAGR